MRSRRALLAFLLCLLLDAAMPFEPAARGGVQLEIGDPGDAGLCARRRHADQPAPVEADAARPGSLTTAVIGRVALVARQARAVEAAAGARRAGLPPARTHVSGPAAPAEDH